MQRLNAYRRAIAKLPEKIGLCVFWLDLHKPSTEKRANSLHHVDGTVSKPMANLDNASRESFVRMQWAAMLAELPNVTGKYMKVFHCRRSFTDPIVDAVCAAYPLS